MISRTSLPNALRSQFKVVSTEYSNRKLFFWNKRVANWAKVAKRTEARGMGALWRADVEKVGYEVHRTSAIML